MAATHIGNDREFKALLAGLPIAEQRRLAAAFVRRVLDLAGDTRVRAALEATCREDMTEAERLAACRMANAARVESYTQCGHETDWTQQAGHFVARAAAACLAPCQEAQAAINPAWEAAKEARKARTCQAIATGEGTENDEAREQYRILEAFLNA